MMSRHRYHKNEVLRCFSGLRTGILTRNQPTHYFFKTANKHTKQKTATHFYLTCL